MYKLILSKRAVKDAELIKRAGLETKVKKLLKLIQDDPFKTPPAVKSLTGELKGMMSRRINRQHRLVYTVDPEDKVVHILRMWTHYKDL